MTEAMDLGARRVARAAPGEVTSGRKARRGGFTRIEVHADPQGALAAWAELESIAPGSLYQTRRWLLPWIATAGRATGLEPMLVLAYRDDLPVAFCPLGLARSGRLVVASFLGGRDSNANLGLFRPGTPFARADLVALLSQAAAKAAIRPDLFVLSNQPGQWEEIANPLVSCFAHQMSPSFCHRAELAPRLDDFLARHLSGEARKKLRRKEKRLAEIGPLAHVRATTATEVSRILDAFIAQKRERLAQMGAAASFDADRTRAFLEAAATTGCAGEAAAIELHGLAVGDRIVATFGGGSHRGRFHGMINSFDLDPEIARSSPGELLLARVIEEKCRAGLACFDLGIGEARYKDSWCDAAEPLFETIVPISLRGRAFAARESLRLRIKRLVKQTGWAWALARKLRARH